MTEAGGRTSHAAIMARSLGVPAVAGVSRITDRVSSGSLMAVDGTSGQVAVNPDERTIKFFETQKALFAELERELLKLKNLPAVTLDGRAAGRARQMHLRRFHFLVRTDQGVVHRFTIRAMRSASATTRPSTSPLPFIRQT